MASCARARSPPPRGSRPCPTAPPNPRGPESPRLHRGWRPFPRGARHSPARRGTSGSFDELAVRPRHERHELALTGDRARPDGLLTASDALRDCRLHAELRAGRRIDAIATEDRLDLHGGEHGAELRAL